jgi:hypothetical protein
MRANPADQPHNGGQRASAKLDGMTPRFCDVSVLPQVCA